MNRTKILWTLIGLQIIYILFIAVWLFIAGMSVMMFNRPEVFEMAVTWLLIAYLLAYPLGLLTALITGWILFARGKYRAALIWNGFPLLWILSALAIWGYIGSTS